MDSIILQGQSGDGGRRWTPAEGAVFKALLSPSDLVKTEAIDILALCLPPDESKGTLTGLVVGNVQSGKTSSFTAVAALAKDNGFNLIVLITGSETFLYDQNADRFEEDLRAASAGAWQFYRSKEIKSKTLNEIAEKISMAVSMWGMNMREDLKRAVVISVMKNGTHLSNVLDVLGKIKNPNLVRALVIDDEADQASLNFKLNDPEPSTIYGRVTALRALLNSVTYLQYTATPQANLLIALDDVLSPSFCRVLTPGPAYTGGAKFFAPESKLVYSIPDADLHDTGTIPPTLSHAMAVFFLGVAYHMRPSATIADPKDTNRSMLIHPHMRTFTHDQYHTYYKNQRNHWIEVLSGGAEAEEEQEFDSIFQEAFRDLQRTVAEEDFRYDDLRPRLHDAISVTTAVILNKDNAKSEKFQHPYTVVIGAIKLDRGNTIKGLSVSYMPRATSRSPVDSAHQRARWFGYKENYIGFCRVFLEEDSIEVYRAIVEHEEHMREQLRAHKGPLSQWRRVFRMDAKNALTRGKVIGISTTKTRLAGEWFKMKPGTGEPSFASRNKILVDAIEAEGQFTIAKGPTVYLSHRVWTGVAASDLLELIGGWHTETPEERTRLLHLRLVVETYVNRFPDARGAVYLMSYGGGEWTKRERSSDGNLHAGAYMATREAKDTDAKVDDRLTVQIHRLRDEQDTRDWFALAVWVPQEYDARFIIADDPS